MSNEKRVIHFSTPYGDHYDVTASGNIIRLDQPDFEPSGQWKLVGLRHVKRTTEFIRFERIAEWLKTKPELTFKNGKPQYTVVDYDHGSRRVWGNTQYHGVRGIYAI